MSQKFPVANYKDVIKIAKILGFIFFRQGKGSHEIWYHPEKMIRITIPNHGKKNIKRKTLKSIIRDLNITVSDFGNIN